MSHIKQVIVARMRYPDGRGGTRKVRMGKLAAQVAHASMKVFLDRAEKGVAGWLARPSVGGSGNPDPVAVIASPLLVVCLSQAEAQWVFGTFTKVVLGVDTEDDLLRAYTFARGRGLPAALVADAGHTEFHKACGACSGQGCDTCGGEGRIPVPTYTTVAIGPADAALIDEITGPEGLVQTRLV